MAKARHVGCMSLEILKLIVMCETRKQMFSWRNTFVAMAVLAGLMAMAPAMAAPKEFSISGTLGGNTPGSDGMFAPLVGASFTGTFSIDFGVDNFYTGADRLYSGLNLNAAAQSVPFKLVFSTGDIIDITKSLVENSAGTLLFADSLSIGSAPSFGVVGVLGLVDLTPIGLTGGPNPTISFSTIYIPVTFSALMAVSSPIVVGPISFLGSGGDSISASTLVSAVPEPEAYLMFFAGLGLMAGVIRRRGRSV